MTQNKAKISLMNDGCNNKHNCILPAGMFYFSSIPAHKHKIDSAALSGQHRVSCGLPSVRAFHLAALGMGVFISEIKRGRKRHNSHPPRFNRIAEVEAGIWVGNWLFFFFFWKIGLGFCCIFYCTTKWISYMYACFASLLFRPPPPPTSVISVSTEPRAELPVLHSSLPLVIYFTHGSVYIPNFLIHHTLPSASPCLHSFSISVFYFL